MDLPVSDSAPDKHDVSYLWCICRCLVGRAAGIVSAAMLGIGVFWARSPDGSRLSSANAVSPDSCVPASTNAIAAQYPCIHPDRSVTLRIKAPDAERVQALIGGGGTQTPMMDMVKQADGNWTLTTPSIVEDFHYYSIFVDGVEMSDPGSQAFFGEMREISGIEIPSPLPDDSFYEIHDVPHGEVCSVLYFSKVVGKWRRCLVHTPPDCDRQPLARFPVLYLLPGYGENELGWFNQGRANVILDNLIAAKMTVPMLVISDDQFTALKPGEAPLVLTGRGPGRGARPNFGTCGQRFTGK